jgi:hypothetical protein
MSHFVVIVTGDNLDEQLQPYHEFECDGDDEQYEQNVDILAKARAKYEADTERRYKDPEGALHEPYDERFLVQKNDGPWPQKISVLPEGWEEVTVPTPTLQTLAEFINGYYGHNIVKPGEEIDLEKSDKHKYGWVKVDETGEVLEAIDRTNPNKKWDWWVVGGRWNGYFPVREGAQLPEGQGGPSWWNAEDAEPKNRANSLRWGDVDIQTARAAQLKEATEAFDKWAALVEQHGKADTWKSVLEKHGTENIEAARAEYNEQPLIKAAFEARFWDPDELGYDRDAYVKRCVDSALVPFAILHEGKWYQRGEMGWWASVSDEKEEGVWEREVAKLFDSFPEDLIVTAVDCHS